MAPISPFISDEIHRGLTEKSVHLADWPTGSSIVDRSLPPRDNYLEEEMSLVRTLAETGRRIRVEQDRRQRLPCRSGWIVGGPDISQFKEILAEELNVENLMTEEDLDTFQKIVIAPNRKSLGAKCRADLPRVLSELEGVDAETFLLEIEAGIAAIGTLTIKFQAVKVSVESFFTIIFN